MQDVLSIPGLERDPDLAGQHPRGRDLGLRRRHARADAARRPHHQPGQRDQHDQLQQDHDLLRRGHGTPTTASGSGARTTRASGCLRGGRSTTSTRRPRSTRPSTSPSGLPTTAPKTTTTRSTDGAAERGLAATAWTRTRRRRPHAAGRGLRPGGAHRVIETTIARTDSTELERGYTGQRGQDEQNRRARKASVQNPGRRSGAFGDVVGRRAREPVANSDRTVMTKITICTPPCRVVLPGAPRRGVFGLLLMLAVVGWPQAAEAQLDPLLLLKRSLPNVTTPQYRAQRARRRRRRAADAVRRRRQLLRPDRLRPRQHVGHRAWRHLGKHDRALPPRCIRACSGAPSAPQKFNATTHLHRRRRGAAAPYNSFYEKTRLASPRRRSTRSITREHHVGPVRPAQDAPDQPAHRVARRWPRVQTPTPASSCRPTASGELLEAVPRRRGWRQPQHRDVDGAAGPAGRRQPERAIRTILAQPLTSSALLPAGNDSFGVDDAPLAHLLDDVRTEAARLLGLDTQCRNTVAVLITGGGEGTRRASAHASEHRLDVPDRLGRASRADLRHRHRAACDGRRRVASALPPTAAAATSRSPRRRSTWPRPTTSRCPRW